VEFFISQAEGQEQFVQRLKIKVIKKLKYNTDEK
jgi:hypothetical protein